MLPKAETEALGPARSHGEQGRMPENMQGKAAPAALGGTAGARSRGPGQPAARAPPPGQAEKFMAPEQCGAEVLRAVLNWPLLINSLRALWQPEVGIFGLKVT